MEWACTGSSNLEQGQSVEEDRDWIMIGSDAAHTDWLYVDGDTVCTDWSGLGEICAVEVAFIKLYGLAFTHVGLDVFDKILDSFLAILDIYLHNPKSQWMVCGFCFIPSYPSLQPTKSTKLADKKIGSRYLHSHVEYTRHLYTRASRHFW